VVGQIRTGDYTEMSGLDWSKQRNVLVTPLRRPAPPQVNGQVTAIYLLDPVQDAIVNNRSTGGGSLPPLRIGSASSGNKLIIWTLGAAPGMSFILESTTDFSSWGNPQSFNGTQLNGGVSVTKNLPEQYFRLRNN